ncbi:MAG: hypothetical protein ACFFCQ_08415 [Promethearchaeota archaeon]
MKPKAKKQPKKCLPNCRLFRCQQRDLKIIKKGENKSFYCTFAEDDCIGAICKHARCKERWINPSRRCGKPEQVRRPKPTASRRERIPEASRDWVYSRLSSKAMKHIKDKDLY